MNNGKKLEALVKKACLEQGVDYTRLKDAGWTGEATTRRFTSKNICDAILFFDRSILFCEVKHRNRSLRFDEITQRKDLEKKWNPGAYQFSGVLAKLNGNIFFITTPQIDKIESETGKESFNDKDAAQFGLAVDGIIPKRSRVVRPHISNLIKKLPEYVNSKEEK